MATALPRKYIRFESNFGGTHDAGDTGNIQPHEALECFNVRLSPTGAIESRRGYYVLNTASFVASGPIIGIFQYARFSGADDTILVVGSGTAVGTQIVRLNTGANTTTSLQPSAGIIYGEPTFAVTNDNLVVGFNTSTQEPITWNGSATAFTGLNSASAPIGSSYHEFKNHLVVLGVFSRPGSWEFSHLGVPTSFRNSDRIDVDRPTVGGNKLFGNFFILTSQGMIRVSGDDRDNFTQEPVRDSVGAVTPRAIVNVDNRGILVWQGTDGHFYEFDGLETRRISNRIENWVQGDSLLFNLDTSQTGLQSTYGVNFISGRRVGFLVRESGDAQNDSIAWYWYDLRTPDPKTGEPVGAWTVDTYDRAFASIGRAILNGVETIYAGDYDGHLCVLETGSTDGAGSATAVDGSDITWRYRKGPYWGESPELTKRWRELTPIVTGSATVAVTVSLRNNYSDTVSTTIAISATASGTSLYQRSQLGERSQALDIQLGSTGSNPPAVVTKWGLVFQELPGLRRP